MIVSPTEPLKLRRLGEVSMFPETFGCDVIMSSSAGWIGVQRKEVADLVASIYDNRLGEQVAKMQGLAEKVLLIEGTLNWSTEGVLLGDRWTKLERSTLRKILWGLRKRGVWVDWSDDVADTARYLTELESWVRKKGHKGLGMRGAARSVWGRADNRDWQIFLLQGLPGVGPEMAERILDQIGMPIGLVPDAAARLTEVKGVGPRTVERIMEALGGNNGGNNG